VKETVMTRKAEPRERLTFLYRAIEDTQQSIRFIDTKLSINSIVFGIFVAFLGSGLSDFAKYFWNMPGTFKGFFLATIIFFLISLGMIISITLNVVYPKSNSSKHISMEYKPKNLFYSGEIEMTFLDSIFDREGITMKPSFEDYRRRFDEMSDSNTMENELIYELLKVSYVRAVKVRRTRSIKIWVIVALVLSLILLYFHFLGLCCYTPRVVT
jgi:hypothetical protein